MEIIKDPQKMRAFSAKAKRRGKIISLVPTMGYLHQGHLSLVKAAARKKGLVVVSIFVNPKQFGPKEDFKRYPRDLKQDLKMLRQLGVAAVFAPSAAKMYAEGNAASITVAGLSKIMCGKTRPDHFSGVATVVAKLFNIIAPDFAFFGQKDYQQLIIIKRLAADLNFPVKIIALPIVRERDGLAMSSRNKYLSPGERRSAARLHQALCLAKKAIKNGARSAAKIISSTKSFIKADKNLKIDYVVLVDPENLTPVKEIKGRALIALAVWSGKTRLIDNMMLRI